jgi:hypothetical protein
MARTHRGSREFVNALYTGTAAMNTASGGSIKPSPTATASPP